MASLAPSPRALAQPLAMFGQKLEAYEQTLLKGAAKTFASQTMRRKNSFRRI